MYTSRLHINIHISSLPNILIGTQPIANPRCVLAAQLNILSQKSYAHTFSCWKDNFVISRFVPSEVSFGCLMQFIICTNMEYTLWTLAKIRPRRP